MGQIEIMDETPIQDKYLKEIDECLATRFRDWYPDNNFAYSWMTELRATKAKEFPVTSEIGTYRCLVGLQIA